MGVKILWEIDIRRWIARIYALRTYFEMCGSQGSNYITRLDEYEDFLNEQLRQFYCENNVADMCEEIPLPTTLSHDAALRELKNIEDHVVCMPDYGQEDVEI